MSNVDVLRKLERVIAEWAYVPYCCCNMFTAKGICWHTGYKHATRP